MTDPKSRKLWLGYVVVLGVLLLLDPRLLELFGVLERDKSAAHEAHFIVDGWPGFYAVFGFVGAWVTVLITKVVIGKLLTRPDTYYDWSPFAPTRDARGRRLPDER